MTEAVSFGSRWGQWLKDQVFYSEEDLKRMGKAPTGAAPATITSPVASVVVPTVSSQHEIDKELYDTLYKAAFGRDTAYTRLMKVVDSMRARISDETTLFSSAFAAANALGSLTMTDIIAGLDIHQAELGDDKENFDAAYGETMEEIAKDEKEVSALDSKMSKLREEIAGLEQKKSALRSGVDSKKASAESSRSKMEKTYKAVIDEIDAAKARVRKHLGGGK